MGQAENPTPIQVHTVKVVESPILNAGDTKTPITLEEAENMLNSKGQRYGDLETDKLTNMLNAMAALQGTPNEKPEHASKMLACQTILKGRALKAKATKPQPEPEQPAA
jgi:hypothetical protein